MRRAAGPHGFSASPAFEHYSAIWARDAAITCLGALKTDDDELIAASEATLRTLAGHVSDKGQVPTAVWADRGYWDWGDAGSVDASAWYVIALAEFSRTTGHLDLVRELWPTAVGALKWLSFQDANNLGLIDSAPASDWMDSSLSRSGKVLSTNALFYWAARSAEQLAETIGEAPPLDSADVGRRLNTLFWPTGDQPLISLLDHVAYPSRPDRFSHPTAEAAFTEAVRSDRSFYVAAVEYGRFVDECDVLANLLSIVSGAADQTRTEVILDYLDAEQAAEPYPTKTWPHPIEPGSDRWGLFNVEADRLQDPRWKNPPGSYHNGGIWPYIGGFHALALKQASRDDAASDLLQQLAEANHLATSGEWGFHEWIHPATGEPAGSPHQTWNAGTYALAYLAVNR